MEPPVGQPLVLVLTRGKRTYSVACVVVSVHGSELRLRREGEREISVPLSAVMSFEISKPPGDNMDHSETRPPTDRDTIVALQAGLRDLVLGRGRNVSASAWGSAVDYVDAKLVDVSDGDVRNAVREMLRGLRLIHEQWLESRFERREQMHHDAISALADAEKLSDAGGLFELSVAVKELRDIAEADERAFVKEASPHVHIASALRDETYHVRADLAINWTVTLSTHNDGPPIEQPQVLVKGNDHVQPIGTGRGPAMVVGGEHCEILVPLQISRLALEDGQAKFSAQVKFRRHDGQESLTKQERFSVVLKPENEFQKVVNPYARFSGGAVVDDDRMFFGRSDLIDRITEIVTQGSSGQCFVLYGQKRTGKTSVLRQLEKRIQPPFLPLRVSVGAIDTADAEISFIQQCIDALYLRLIELGVTDLAEGGWPNDQKISARPLESFRRAFLGGAVRLSKKTGWKGCRPVILIDEFTYMYEYIKEGRADASFMRQWKSLLETGLFNAVIVGQDSLPHFKQAFPNEFGVTHDERISYLSNDDARHLAEQPLLLSDKSSRYRGYALEKVIGATAGHPFFEMIVCDNLVRFLNENRVTHVTERAVDQIVSAMCAGPSALTPDRFDSLITAAGESVALATSDDYYRCLEAIAVHEELEDGAVNLPELDQELVRDLVMREVVMRLPDGRISIRVPLFAQWLRAQVLEI